MIFNIVAQSTGIEPAPRPWKVKNKNRISCTMQYGWGKKRYLKLHHNEMNEEINEETNE